MGLQALIFDVDGTLAETAEVHRAAFNQAFEECAVAWFWDRRVYSYIMHMTDDAEMLRAYNAMFAAKMSCKPLSIDALQRIKCQKTKIYLAMLKSGTAYLRTGVARLLQEAKREDIAIAVTSSRPRIEFETLVINTLGFDALSMFDTVQAGTSVAPYSRIAQKLGVNPAKSVVIDTSFNSIKILCFLWLAGNNQLCLGVTTGHSCESFDSA